VIHLIGGGWDPGHAAALYGGFLGEAGDVAARSGRPGKPVVACVVYDEGDGRAQFARWESVLTTLAFCEPVPVLIGHDVPLDVSALGNSDALLVCGGLTPGYAAAIAPAAAEVLDWLLLGDRPYAGFSAGSATAAASALVGGWLSGGVPVCPDDAAEDLVEITVQPGLGLVPFLVDVHCAQWGTLPRLISAVGSVPGSSGVGIDENTVLIVDGATALVAGGGQVWHVNEDGGAVHVRSYRHGQYLTLPDAR
jgi:cyanophycinase